MTLAALSAEEERASRSPLVSDELARRLEQATVAYDVEWLEPVARREVSPGGLTVRRFGQAVAFATPGRPELDFVNRVSGLWPEDAARVAEIARWYSGLGLRFWTELVPVRGVEATIGALKAVGAGRIGFHSVVWGGAGEARGAVSAPGAEVRVGEVETAADLPAFVSSLLDGHGVPAEARAGFDLHSHWRDLAGWRFYRASLRGEPAGAAVMRVGDGVALLATASTVPRFRRRGVQSALIARRLADADAAGCELVTSAAAAGSGSLSNLRRSGLRLAYTKTVWRLGA